MGHVYLIVVEKIKRGLINCGFGIAECGLVLSQRSKVERLMQEERKAKGGRRDRKIFIKCINLL